MKDVKRKRTEIARVAILLVVFVVGVTIAYNIQKEPDRLPIINPADINPALVEDSLEGKGMNHHISDFSLYDQKGVLRSLKDVEGQILIADFFFSTCPSICIDMTRNLGRVQEKFADQPMVRILSHTVQPEYDSVPILATYAEDHNVNYDQWWLLTGDRDQIYSLARTSYFAVMEEGQSWDEHSFIHTENIIVIDPLGRIRGMYDGTDDVDMDLLMNQLEWLIDEFEGND